ncbi:MAG: VOC family protein [Hyphomicrobium sp.]|nr:VOC family protein [Hyphomicrobium sp.]
MALPVPTLDHVVINARTDIDGAAETFRRLGFTLTERGYHTLGSMNHLAMFGTDYLELIAVPKDAAPDVRPDVQASPYGLNGFVFGMEDSAALHAALSAAGVNAKAPREFSRPVRLRDGEHQATFRTVSIPDSDAPYGRIYYCHHLTRDLVWRDEWRRHANGVVAVSRAVFVHPDPAAAAQLYARMFGADAVRDIEGGKRVVVAATDLEIVPEATARREFGDGMPDAAGRPTYMAVLGFRTSSVQRAADVLKQNGIPFAEASAGVLHVPARAAFNTTLTFGE